MHYTYEAPCVAILALIHHRYIFLITDYFNPLALLNGPWYMLPIVD